MDTQEPKATQEQKENVLKIKINTLYTKKFDAKMFLDNLCSLQEKEGWFTPHEEINCFKEQLDFKLFNDNQFQTILKYPDVLFECLCEYEKQIDMLIKSLKTNILIVLEKKGFLETIATSAECFYSNSLLNNVNFSSILYDSIDENGALTEFIDKLIS